MTQPPALARVILYVHDMQRVANFYQTYFGYEVTILEDGNLIHLTSSVGGCHITILKASKGHKLGQSQVKLVFEVSDVEAFKTWCAEKGLRFGVTHTGENYAFSNARDPAQNLIQISSRHI